MDTCQKEFFRDQLRSARAVALADAEGFQAIIHSLELIGYHMQGRVSGLGDYEKYLSKLAKNSPLVSDIPSQWPGFHTKFSTLYEDMKTSRNDAVHQGAHARTLANHAVELAIILEDALMSNFSAVSQFMVRDVIQAEPWQPVSFVRQQMLKYAFSYIPVQWEGSWQLIAEFSIAQYLHSAQSKTCRRKRLAGSVRDAVNANKLNLLCATVVSQEAKISAILKKIGDRPILVVDPKHDDVLVGLLTSSDIV